MTPSSNVATWIIRAPEYRACGERARRRTDQQVRRGMDAAERWITGDYLSSQGEERATMKARSPGRTEREPPIVRAGEPVDGGSATRALGYSQCPYFSVCALLCQGSPPGELWRGYLAAS